MKPIRRHEDSVIGRIERYFRENPEEELSYADIAAKFGVSIGYARTAVLKAADAAGKLESVHVVRLRAAAKPPIRVKQLEEH